jgi:hypothetical protein
MFFAGFDSGYEETIAKNCRYHLLIKNIFRPKKLRLLQRITGWLIIGFLV